MILCLKDHVLSDSRKCSTCGGHESALLQHIQCRERICEGVVEPHGDLRGG